MAQHVVGNSHQRILLDKHLAILHDKCQAIDIGVNNNAEVGTLAADNLRDLGEVLGEWLRVVGKLARRLAIKLNNLAA